MISGRSPTCGKAPVTNLLGWGMQGVSSGMGYSENKASFDFFRLIKPDPLQFNATQINK